MKKVFLDTNILIDFLGERVDFYDDAAKIVSLADAGLVEMYASSLSYATASYILAKYDTAENVTGKLRKFATLCHISGVDEHTVSNALYSDFSDFEDALQFYSAIAVGSDIIVTRNKKDFDKSCIPVFTPKEYLITLLD